RSWAWTCSPSSSRTCTPASRTSRCPSPYAPASSCAPAAPDDLEGGRRMNRCGPLRVAGIGAGRMAADHVRSIDRLISGARVTAVVDIDAARAEAVAADVEGCTAHTDPAAAMASADVDAVIVASSGPAHEAALLTAFERDLPVLCEKPLTPDAASALRVMEAEQALGHRRVQVGFMRRYDTEYTHLKALLDSGRLGRPLM